jgi:D-alanyl-D-alanine endopeptidase (penicillin-binding protein 7)
MLLLLAPGPADAQQTSGSKGSTKPVAGKSTPTKKVTKARRTRASLARARAAAAARARLAAAARQRQQREAMTPRFKRDLLGNLVPDVRAAAAIIFDPASGEVLWEENSRDQRSIASITKVMTALVFLADEPDLTQRVTVSSADVRRASVTYLRAGENITYDDLLHLMLIASDNGAARVVARTSEGGTKAFVGRMNEMARHLNLEATHYTDPSGLESTNLSSAYDLSQLIAFAAGDPLIASVMRMETYEAHPSAGPVSIHSTNKLLGTDMEVRAGKTGFISKAGYCLATLLQLPQGNPVAVVVLGAANSTTRFWEARHLFNWVVGRTQGIVGGDNQN